MSEQPETVTFEIDGGGGDEQDQDTLTVPARLVDAVAEEGQTAPEVVGDVAMLSLANRVHHIVHHHDGDDADLAAVEETTMELFEERFGVSFAEATGHSH